MVADPADAVNVMIFPPLANPSVEMIVVVVLPGKVMDFVPPPSV